MQNISFCENVRSLWLFEIKQINYQKLSNCYHRKLSRFSRLLGNYNGYHENELFQMPRPVSKFFYKKCYISKLQLDL